MKTTIRDRSWRRYKQERIVIKRLIRNRNSSNYWHGFIDANGILIKDPKWIDFIGTDTEFSYKTMTTHRYQTKYKSKWRKRGEEYWSNKKLSRVSDKKLFIRILKDEVYGFI